jgi:son of sevenless
MMIVVSSSFTSLTKSGIQHCLAAASSKTPPRGAKLRKILGDDAPQAYIDKVNADLKKWYLRSDYSATDLLTDPEGTVRGGTLQALAERLTTHDAPGEFVPFLP